MFSLQNFTENAPLWTFNHFASSKKADFLFLRSWGQIEMKKGEEVKIQDLLCREGKQFRSLEQTSRQN